MADVAAGRYGAAEVWHDALARLSTRLNAQVFHSWFRPVAPVELRDGTLVLGVPSAFHLDWLRDHYVDVMEAEISRDGTPRRVKLTVVEGMDAPPSDPPVTVCPGTAAPATSVVTAARDRLPNRLNSRYTLENFVQGPSNQFAAAAAQAVADNAGKAYNPLFIFSNVGLGKTHLLHAIGNRVARLRPDWGVVYVSGESFTNEFIEAVRGGGIDRFRARYRASCDVLLLDDVHFIAGKERTQEEFFHSFNHLYGAGKQVVVTSDKFPHEIPGLEERLRTRLQWGLVADMQPPELETRVAILQAKAADHGVALPGDVAHFIASRARHNVRELEGSLVRLVAASSFRKVPLTLELCQVELRDLVMRGGRTPTCEEIQRHVGELFRVEVGEMRGPRRERRVTLPRQTAMYLCRKYTQASLPEIGAAFGGRDHTTVLASVRKVEELVKRDPEAARAVASLGRILEKS
jgi:chromosomal replication initiator protein